jgi:uncharacterized membrane protein YfcA
VGLGGGAFYVPLLLALGYPYALASSVSLFLIAVTGFSAFSRFLRARLVDWKLAVLMDTFTDIGAFVGGYTAVNFSAPYLKTAFGIFLVLAAYFILRMQRQKQQHHVVKESFGYWKRQFVEYRYSIFMPAIIPITFAIGFFSGTLGVAGGLLKVPIMILWFGVPAKIAVATSSLMVGLTGLLGFSGHLFTGDIDWLLSSGLGVVVLIGGQFGSRISIMLSEKKVKRVLALVFVLMAVWMISNSI